MRQKITAYVIAYNEEATIADSVKSVLWADEVVVADSFSTDATATIAESLGARVVQIAFEGFGDLRNKAIAFCSHDWIFSLDADERCTDEARQEIQHIIQSPDALDAYHTPRKNFFLGKEIKHCGWYPDYRQPQLFRKNAVVYNEDLVHEGFYLTGRLGYMKNAIIQIPYRNISHMCCKLERYSTLGASKLLKLNRTASVGTAIIHGLAAFIRIYIVKLGILDGWPGFLIAFANFEYAFYKYAKLKELCNTCQPPR